MKVLLRFKSQIITLLLTFAILPALAQLSSNADGIINTEYSGTVNQDEIHVFCGNKGELNANLEVSTNLTGTINYEWQKYDANSGTFEIYSSEANGGSNSSISGLEDGGYRAVIENGTDTETYTAWVFNNYYEVNASITESNCDYFQLEGTFDSPVFTYYDLGNNQAIDVDKQIEVEWTANGDRIAAVISPAVYGPPTEDTDYTLSVTDKFGCIGEFEVTYFSIVTKAQFSIEAEFFHDQTGEAPLEVTFINESENGTNGEYEWFFFKDLNIIKREAEANTAEIDSIDFVAYDNDLTYTYENSGTYMVKLVSKKISELHTCTDTFYLDDYMVADTSFVDAANFFTPNGDGANDNFVVQFISVKDIKISIFNRWGKKVHFWEKSDVRGFVNSIENIPEAVWDGKIGNKMASPGVYYYVVEAVGRDDRKRYANGFFHLFRGKQ